MATAAEMVVLIDAEIERRLTPGSGGGVKKASSDASSFETYGLEELKKLREYYQKRADAAANTNGGGLKLTKTMNKATSRC